MPKPLSRTARIVVWFVLAVVCVIALLLYWRHAKMYPSTDDAYVQANIVHIAPQISGPVSQIYVKNFDQVKQGQLLFTIDPRPFVAAKNSAEANLVLAEQKVASDVASVQEAKSNVTASESQLSLAESNAKRILKLVKDGQMSAQEGDKVRNDLKVAHANLETAKEQLRQSEATLGQPGKYNADIREAAANLATAKLNLSYTKVYAPEAGQLANFDLRPGNMLTANQTVFDIVEKNSWWVASNFKETDLGRIHPNQAAKIVLDMYPGHIFQGKVLEVSPGSGAAFALLPPENASGNWVKVTQRFPVRVLVTDKLSKLYPLRVGASATVEIDTAK